MNTNLHKTIGQVTIAYFALLALALPNQTYAQFTGNNQTNIISGVPTNFPTVTAYSGDSLIISNGGNVFSTFAYVGSTSGSNNNVLVTGGGSFWSNTNNLYIGNLGSANRVAIIDGGTMLNGNNCYIGYTGFRSNSVLVSGNGSLLSNHWDLFVGYAGAGNTLMISAGGKVINHYGSLGAGSGSNGSGSSNSVCVTGSNSVWQSQIVAISGRGNELVVSNGGTVVSWNASIGAGTGASANRVRITGRGSDWQNTSDALYVGNYPGSNNSLVIDAAGIVVSAFGIIGNSVGASNNIVLVSGSGSVWSNYVQSPFAGDDGFRPVCVGYSGAGNSLVISNGGAVFSGGGLRPVLGGSGPYIPGAVLGYNSSATSNNVLVTGPGSAWRNSGCNVPYDPIRGLVVGYSSAGNALTISNGGAVTTCEAYVGLNNGADGNRINISGGNLSVTNEWGDSILNVLRGKLTFDGGTVTADTVLLKNGSASTFTFNNGLLNCKTTIVDNAQQFVVGNGANSATFHLLGGEHSFTDGLRIRTNSFLTGCGAVNGNVLVDAGGTVLADCGGTLTFTGNVTNNGVMLADNGSILESSGTLVNNGTILLLDSSTANFYGTFINNGVILKPDIHLAIERDGSGGLFIRFTGAPDVTYRLQRAASVTGPWTDLAANIAPASGLIEYHETSPLPGQAFYRAVQP